MADAELSGLTPLQNAVFLLKQAQARLAAYEYAQAEPIAVVGMGCRFPGGADGPEAYWRLLSDGVDAVRDVPPERWNIDDYYDPDPTAPGKMNTRWGGFLKDVDQFDADFFGISPREAIRVDPQHRLLLEVSWEALEDAGVVPGAIAQTKAGVFIGVIGSDYALLQSRELADIDVFSGTGSSHAILANRLSYVLNLNGPSIALDTACSSSLVTVHLACQSLRRRETDLALAGGVNLILGPEMTLTLTKAHMMSPDGRCHTFDAAANGYVRGEGCGVVVLKRLSDAVAASDRILALIRGSAVNHDGRSNGLSAPNGPAQEAVIHAALRDAGLQPRHVSYIEAHGTGTRLGDPIEIEALRAVFGRDRSEHQPLVVGSVKTNIGHLESAAGIAGLLKIILALRHSQIPPHLHLRTINPLLKLDETPIEISTATRAWPQGTEPRRAGVSSFGFGGTNGHVVLEEAPQGTPQTSRVERPRHLLTLSARSPQALGELAGRYAACMVEQPAASMADIAYTAATGRTHFSHRLAISAESTPEAAAALAKFAADPAACGACRGEVVGEQSPRIAFLFTGQGAQYGGMGLALYQSQLVFRAAIDRCAELLKPQLDRPLLSLLDPQAGTILDQTGYTQPVMFALEYALATLWRSWGVEPAAVLGHSVGEFAAVCVAGVLSLEDAISLIAMRARLMQALPPGGKMAAVFATEAQVSAAIAHYRDQVAIAALNGPESIVISGDAAAVDNVLACLESQHIKSKPLATSHAFHSQRMDEMLDDLRHAAARVACSKPKIDIVANLTGQLADEQTFADPCYWSLHARSPVQFARSMQVLADRGCNVFLEIGPSPTLIGLGQRCLVDGDYTWLTSLRRGRDEWQSMLDSLGHLYVRGAKIDWAEFDRPYARAKVAMPTYPFQRKRYWAGTVPDGSSTAVAAPQRSGRAAHPLLGRRLVAAVAEQVFESQISVHRPATVADHKVQGKVIMPGAAYLEMALAAATTLHDKTWCVKNMSLVEPLLLGKTAEVVQTIVKPEGQRSASIHIVSLKTGEGEGGPQFATHAVGHVAATADAKMEVVDLESVRARFSGEPRDTVWRTEALRKSGLEPGPTFAWLVLHWTNPTEALGTLRPPCEADRADQFRVHPGLLDSTFQLLGSILPGAGTGIDAYIPMSFDCLQCFTIPQGPLWALARQTSYDGTLAVGDVDLIDAQGNVVLKVQGVTLRRVSRDWVARLVAGPLPDWCYELAWTSQPIDSTASNETALAPGRWLICDSADGLGMSLAERLRMKSHECALLPAGVSADARRDAVRQFLTEEGLTPHGVVYLSGLNGESGESPDFAAARGDGWGAVLDLVQVLAGSGTAKPPRLWLATRGAQAAGGAFPVSLAQSPTWGLGRVIASEYPEMECTRIDLDGAAPAGSVERSDEADHLAEELLYGQQEDQIAFRGGERLVARLRRLDEVDAGVLQVPRGSPYRLEITSRGQLDSVSLHAVGRQAPGPGQVEIKVHATGLNFRDVLNVLDLYPGDPGPLGGECAGEIVAVGPGVERFRPGDAVLALAPGSFASYVTTLAEFVAPMPRDLTFPEAATIPICFLTVQHALRTLGGIQPGERVLIHAASGGVGLAAIQLAQQVGAEVFATAGSPRKREYLRSLGIQHVMDSRALDFAQQILEATGGQGVDLVLNSLTGEAIPASLSVLRTGGRFLELGKTDLWDASRVDAVRPGVKFFAIALDHMMAHEPQSVARLLGEVLPLFQDKTLRPLPLRTFSIPRVVDALRHMARTEHIGKVVIQAASLSEPARRTLTLREDATYLITGGLGGLGLKLAEWLVERGARRLVLVGRSGASAEARRQLDGLMRPGVEIAARQCDISQRAELAAVLDEIGREKPLAGVFHLAGMLDDGVLREQSRERFDRVMAAKAQGAWYLHELTRGTPLELFVLFSSAAAILGSPGQANYAAANAFLDALAHHRRGLKLPALSVNWGSWDEVGMAARLKETEGQRWAAAGIGWIGLEQGLATLERLILEDRAQAAVLPIDWPKFFARIPAGSEPAWLLDMARTAGSAKSDGESGPPELLQKLQSVTPAERLELTVTSLRREAARVLAMDEAHLPDPRRTLNELGFDSLTAVEFCNRVSRAIGERLNPTVLFDYPTLENLAAFVLRDLLALPALEEAQPAAVAQSADQPIAHDEAVKMLDDVEVMSEAEMDALVIEQLGRLQQ
jgi:acyl transferase domain-containing protein/NADPH:quinone reductase-like Zn-dependent oxidoreductase/acyl carrier protein